MPTTRNAAIGFLARGIATLIFFAGGLAMVAGGCDSSSSSATTFTATCTVDTSKPPAGQCGAPAGTAPTVEVNGCNSNSNGQTFCGSCATKSATPCSYCPNNQLCPEDPCATSCVAKGSTSGGSTGGSTTGGSGSTGGTGGNGAPPSGVTCTSNLTCTAINNCTKCNVGDCVCETSCGIAAWYTSSDGQTFLGETCGDPSGIGAAATAVINHCCM